MICQVCDTKAIILIHNINKIYMTTDQKLCEILLHKFYHSTYKIKTST